ncbi:MAG: ABC transporter permease subunit [Solirubrobacteraceae bacterium]
MPRVTLGGTTLTDAQLYALAIGITVVGLAVVGALADSPVGRAWRADRDDPVAAVALGVPGARLRVLAFTLGSAVAGLGGALYVAHTGFVSSTAFSLPETVDVILVTLLAGDGRMLRTVVVAAGLTIVVDRLAGFASVSEAVTGTLVLVVVAHRLGATGWVLGRVRRWLSVRA